jgi:hypothetical protein
VPNAAGIVESVHRYAQAGSASGTHCKRERVGKRRLARGSDAIDGNSQRRSDRNRCDPVGNMPDDSRGTVLRHPHRMPALARSGERRSEAKIRAAVV